jgi:archaeal type IV pilus assembly protein PilA
MQIGKNKTRKNDEGVSPVIGVILMVAITVMMSAIVSSWSSGVKANTPTTIGLDISRSGNNVTVLVTSIDPANAAPLPLLNISYQNWSISGFKPDSTNITNANVGDLKEFNTNDATLKRVIITASYKDNSKKVLFSQEV